MRNDTTLYTGVTSATNAEELKARRNRKKNEKVEKRTQLTPVEELIFDLLNKELENTRAQLIKTVDEESDMDVIKLEVGAGRKYIESIGQLKSKLRNILRVK